MKRGTVLILTGFLLMLSALGLTAFNIRTDAVGAAQAQSLMTELSAQLPPPTTAPAFPADLPEIDLSEPTAPEAEEDGRQMPVKWVKGISCVGVLSMPTIERELPVNNSWDYDRLKYGPCRYAGTCYSGNLVLCAHNYKSHFGKISQLRIGDPLRFTDMDGNAFDYTVREIEILKPDQIEDMTASDADLTLFTCTIGGATRVTVRCSRATV